MKNASRFISILALILNSLFIIMVALNFLDAGMYNDFVLKVIPTTAIAAALFYFGFFKPSGAALTFNILALLCTGFFWLIAISFKGIQF